MKVRYFDCRDGWLHMEVSTENQSVTIQMSEVFDPIPDLIKWMEAILTDVMECSFELDEEGTDKRFVSRRGWNERARISQAD